MLIAVSVDCAEAHALEDGVRAEAAGQLADALDGGVAALADDVGRAERPRQRDPIRVAPEQDDLLGAEPPRRDDAAEADRAIADHRHALPRADLRRERRVVARPHHVGEREQRRHQRVVAADREHDQRAVGLRDAHRLALAAVELGAAPPAAVQA